MRDQARAGDRNVLDGIARCVEGVIHQCDRADQRPQTKGRKTDREVTACSGLQRAARIAIVLGRVVLREVLRIADCQEVQRGIAGILDGHRLWAVAAGRALGCRGKSQVRPKPSVHKCHVCAVLDRVVDVSRSIQGYRLDSAHIAGQCLDRGIVAGGQNLLQPEH